MWIRFSSVYTAKTPITLDVRLALDVIVVQVAHEVNFQKDSGGGEDGAGPIKANQVIPAQQMAIYPPGQQPMVYQQQGQPQQQVMYAQPGQQQQQQVMYAQPGQQQQQVMYAQPGQQQQQQVMYAQQQPTAVAVPMQGYR